MKDLYDMTSEERREWMREQAEKSRAEFAGRPVPRISRAKREDYPHLELVGWSFGARPGTPAVVVRADGSTGEGRLLGLYEVDDAGPTALVVELDELWALRRQAAAGWDRDAQGRVTVEVLQVPVLAWPVGALGVPPEAEAAGFVLPRPTGEPERWTVQTNKLEGQR